MGVVLTQNVTDTGGGLFERLVRGQTALVHGVQDAAVNRLQAVPDIRKGTAHDDAHSVLNIGFFHLIHQIGCGDGLIREENIFRFIVSVMLCQNDTSKFGMLERYLAPRACEGGGTPQGVSGGVITLLFTSLSITLQSP